MAAATHFLSLNPKTLTVPRSSAAVAPSPFLIISSKPPSKSVLFLSQSNCAVVHSSHVPLGSKFSGKVSFSSGYEIGEDELSGSEEASFSPDAKLFVGNLPFTVDSAALAGLFEQAGNVQMVEVIYDKITGRSRGFGFVTMCSIEEAEAAVQQFNGYDLQGRSLRVNSGPPPTKRENTPLRGGPRGRTSSDDGNRVYVGNLAWEVDDVALETLFSEQGKVKEARVVYDRESGRSRGFGFVTYYSPDEVNNAVESLDGADLSGRSIRVSPAEERPRRQF